jgi:hemerythrin-like metal-binding protein
MMKLSWDEHFSVGVAPMDKQHQVIFDHMSAICSALEGAAPRSKCVGLLQTFDIYCKMHFFEEERLMDGMNFSALAHHQRQHDLFVTNLEHYMAQTHWELDEFIAIRDWFLSHILKEDIPYGLFMRNHP